MCHCTYVIAANPSCKTEVDMWQRSRLQTHYPTCNLDSMLCAEARTPMSWKKQLSVLFTLLAFSLKVFVCLFLPLSSSPVSVLNLMWLGLSAWRNNRNWKITERMKCKNINLRRALTIKKVLRKGWKMLWIYLTEMYGRLRYWVETTARYRKTVPLMVMVCPFLMLSVIPLFASTENGSFSSIRFCYWFQWENIWW